MIHKRFFIPGLAIATHLIGDEQTKTALIIDPSREVESYLDYLKDHQLTLSYILETHVHADFVSGAKELKSRVSQAKPPLICASAEGGEEWQADYADKHLRDKDVLDLGKLTIQCLYTPGHTPEHLSYLVFSKDDNKKPLVMFSGDFIFVGAIGRPDLLGFEAQKKLASQLYESIFNRLVDLPDQLELFPTHGAGSLCGKNIGTAPSTTLGEERKKSSSFQEKTKEKWVEELMQGMPPAPPYFSRMKRVNKEGPSLLGQESQLLAVSPFDAKGHQIVDIRSIEEYPKKHIPGSINLPFGASLPYWGAWVLQYDLPTYLVGEDEKELNEAAKMLRLVGFDTIQGFIKGGVLAWEQSGLPVAHFSLLSADQLLEEQKKGTTLIDVRTPGEWESAHIKGAQNIPLSSIVEGDQELDKKQPLAVICGTGYRASIAVSLLKGAGFDNVSNVMGGMASYQSLAL